MRRLPAAARRHAAAAAVLLGSLVALATGTVGSPTSVGATAVGIVRPTSSAVTDLVAVGCGDASDCVAVGGSPTTIDVVPISSGVPGTPHPVAGVSRLAGVGCWSSTECLAIGTATNGDGVVVPISDGVPGAAQPVAGTQQLSAISCPGAGLCVVAGGHGSTQGAAGVVLSITDGVVSAPVIVHGVNWLSGIGCGAVDDCLAAGYADRYVAVDALIDIHGGVPGPPKMVVPGTASLSCSAPGDCVGIWRDEVIPISGGPPGCRSRPRPPNCQRSHASATTPAWRWAEGRRCRSRTGSRWPRSRSTAASMRWPAWPRGASR